MESIFYNLQNIIINLKKLNNTFTENKITTYHYDLAKLYIYQHSTEKLKDINSEIDTIVNNIGSLEVTNKYYPKEYKNFIICEKLKNIKEPLILLIIHPIYYNDNIELHNIIFEKEIIFDGKLEYNNFLEQLYPNEGNLIEKTNKYYTDKPLRLYLLSECKIKNKKYNILKDNNIILNIIKLSLHPRSLDDFEGLTYSMKYKLSNVKSNKDDNCFIITSTSLEYINIDDEYESIEMPYYKKKEIIYNPKEYYYHNGYKYIRNHKTVKELITLFNNPNSI